MRSSSYLFFAITFLFGCGILKSNAQFANNSVLSQGNWYKFGVVSDGVYAISFNDLQASGVTLAGATISNIRVFSNGGRMLPENTSASFYDDLTENAIMMKDVDGNGAFNGNDQIVFYGKGPNNWNYSGSCSNFIHERNIYSDTTYYFLTATPGVAGLRVQDKASLTASPEVTLNTFEDYYILENDSVNLNESGRQWFWKEFGVYNNFTFPVSVPFIDLTKEVSFRVGIAERCLISTGTIYLRINGIIADTLKPTVISSVYDGPIANYTLKCKKLLLPSSTFTISLQKADNNCEKGWLDFIEFNATRNLVKTGTQMHFVNSSSLNHNVVQYIVNSVGTSFIWDITDPLHAENQLHAGGTFNTDGNLLRRFITFNNSGFLPPYFIGKVNNQNLHGLGYADILIVTPPDFLAQAGELAQHHFDHDGLTSHIVTTNQIYNEFSSGSQDITAIRNFARMFYKRNQAGLMPMPPYLLLFGDASYDYKTHLNRTFADSNGTRININTNLVPTYQNFESLRRDGWSYGSDDYFAILSDNANIATGIDYKIDIGVGRLLSHNSTEASALVNKIKHYVFNPDCQRDWRNRVTLVADDMEASWEGGFVSGSELLYNLMKTNYPVWNMDKVYIDSYNQVVSSGQRYPEAQKAIFDKINDGTLMINYIGHGGESGWAAERILTDADINEWKNYDRMPAFLAATCTFTRFDNPKIESAGEIIQLRPDGGGIALFSTVRPISIVDAFNQPFYDAAFGFDSLGRRPRLGDLLRIAKNKFGQYFPQMLLFGDPAMKLAYPENSVKVTSVKVNGVEGDTLKATDIVTVTGYIADLNGFKLTDFNGRIYPTVFDKASILHTLQNDDAAAKFNFELQKNILFKGKAGVTNGDFTFTFKVPKDINYQLGYGKMSFYAENTITDAHGYKTITVGGSSNNCEDDQKGPTVSLFLNDVNFLNGGITDANPSIYAVITDDGGINTTGSGIGHDITATLTGPVSAEYILNEFYESDSGSYQSGKLLYLLRNLPEGEYTLTLKVWDACNNSGSATITFTVNTSELVMYNLYNFPNPFQEGTTFSFQHNLPGTDLDAEIRIYDMQGRMVHQIAQIVNSDGYRNVQIYWNGTSSAGGRLASGVYFYTLFLKDNLGNSAKATSKMVLVN